MSVPSQCPLCGAGSSEQDVRTAHVSGGRRDQAFFQCAACDIIYQYPYLTSKEEAHFYAEEYEGFMSKRSGETTTWDDPEIHAASYDAHLERRMGYLKPYLAKKARILEIGCASGFTLYPLAKLGHECFGVEPSTAFNSYVNSRNIPCFESIEALKKDPISTDGFDLIMHFFVLEHVGKPFDFIQSLMPLLKKGGRMIIEIPCVADALLTVYDIPEFERFYWSAHHPWYFSELALRNLLNRFEVNYDIQFAQRYDLSNHMTWALERKSGGTGRYTDLLGKEIEEAYKQGLVRARKCDTLIAILEN